MRPCYIRFGHIPDCGYSTNFNTGQPEAGVSVFEAVEVEGAYRLLMPLFKPDLLITCLSLCYTAGQSLKALEGRPVFEVEGKPVGIGSDGEPVLAECRIVKALHPVGLLTQS